MTVRCFKKHGARCRAVATSTAVGVLVALVGCATETDPVPPPPREWLLVGESGGQAPPPIPPYAGVPRPAAPASPAAPGTGSGRTEPVPIGPAPPASQPELPRDLLEALVAWRQAWQDGDTRTYLSMYDPAFRGTHRSARDWQLERTRRLRERPLRIVLRDAKVRELAVDRAVIGWVQDYRSARHADTGWKELVWQRQSGTWRIAGETWQPLPGSVPFAAGPGVTTRQP